jgi:hypothetical protein
MKYRDRYYWFPAMKVGWGWGIANTWQGALIQVAYPLLTYGIFRYLGPQVGVGMAMTIFGIVQSLSWPSTGSKVSPRTGGCDRVNCKQARVHNEQSRTIRSTRSPRRRGSGLTVRSA